MDFTGRGECLRTGIERLRRVAFDYRAMALRHPGFFPFFAVHRLHTRPGARLGYAKGPTAAEKVPAAEVERSFPAIVAVGSYFNAQHHLKTFVAGLEVVLEGIRASRNS